MKQPSLDKMMAVVDSKYSLVVATAKRARMITEGKKALVEGDYVKPVTMAMHEILNHKVLCINNEEKSEEQVKTNG